jgi:uncharacterized protein YciI
MNTAYRLLIFFLLLGQLAFTQDGKLVKIPGTKCSLIPPAGFVAIKNSGGFEDPQSGATIMVNELPASYQESAMGFGEEKLAAMGMTLVSKKTLDVNNLAATLFHVTQVKRGVTYVAHLLIFGDEETTVLIKGYYPDSAKAIMSRKIIDAVLSTTYDKAQDDDPLEAAPFTLDVGTDLKPAKYVAGILLYTRDGEVPTSGPLLLVTSADNDSSTANPKKFAETGWNKITSDDFVTTEKTQEITINGLKGYEFIGKAETNRGRTMLYYFVILFDTDGSYHTLLGKSMANADKSLKIYKRIAATFRPK